MKRILVLCCSPVTARAQFQRDYQKMILTKPLIKMYFTSLRIKSDDTEIIYRPLQDLDVLRGLRFTEVRFGDSVDISTLDTEVLSTVILIKEV